MKTAFFDTHQFEREGFIRANSGRHEITFLEVKLTEQTATLARGCEAVCCFVNDQVTQAVLNELHSHGVKLIALRSAGFNNVDLKKARELDMTVVRVPEYSPYAVAEYAASLLMTLNRKIHKANTRVHELNFSLEGLVGFDLHAKTIGVIGSGRIGTVFAKIMIGFGCRVLVYDTHRDPAWADKLGVTYVGLDELMSQSDVISLHVPLNEGTKHLIDGRAISLMKTHAILINTGRGALVETHALIDALKTHRIAGAALDVYEEEEGIFFNDLSVNGIDDDLLARLITFPNVLLTSHQAFLTHEALQNIAETTIDSMSLFEDGKPIAVSRLLTAPDAEARQIGDGTSRSHLET